MSSTSFRNAKIVLAEAVLEGSLSVEDGLIGAIDSGSSGTGADLEGDYLLAGLVELHTDHLENHYRPRLKIFWPPAAALHAHDVQIAGSGITTVFDAVRIGSDADLPNMDEHAAQLIGAIREGGVDGTTRAEHFIHLRCELPSPDVAAHFEQFCSYPEVRLASIMDHTPGQRQFQSIEHYAMFYKRNQSDAEFASFIVDRQSEQSRYADANRRAIFELGRARGVVFASHDDATVEHVEDSLRDGVRIAEFPTTKVAAEASHAGGLAVLMGAPNVVRGKSHSGNVSAKELAVTGCLDILSSDYVPFAPMQAAFLLPELVAGMTLPQAVAMVSRNPARAVGLDDRGEIRTGLRADLVRVSVVRGHPVVREVWRQGVRIS